MSQYIVTCGISFSGAISAWYKTLSLVSVILTQLQILSASIGDGAIFILLFCKRYEVWHTVLTNFWLTLVKQSVKFIVGRKMIVEKIKKTNYFRYIFTVQGIKQNCFWLIYSRIITFCFMFLIFKLLVIA